jgi:hypothetical protein
LNVQSQIEEIDQELNVDDLLNELSDLKTEIFEQADNQNLEGFTQNIVEKQIFT